MHRVDSYDILVDMLLELTPNIGFSWTWLDNNMINILKDMHL